MPVEGWDSKRVTVEGSIVDRAWPAWVWSPQDRSIVAANAKARALWNLAPTTSITGFLFPAKAKVTRKLHGAAVALLAGADQVQVDIKLPFAREETWQCRRLRSQDFADGTLLLEAPQYAATSTSHVVDTPADEGARNYSVWSDEAFNALGLPVIMIAADGKIMHLNHEADRLAPSDILTDETGELWSRPWHFRDFFSSHDDVDHALSAMAETHRTGSASFIASLMGVPGFPGGRVQIILQRVGAGLGQAPLMVTFHKLAESQPDVVLQKHEGVALDQVHEEISNLGAMAFELNEKNQVIFFTPEFATWIGKDPQDIGGKKIADLGLTPASGAAIMQLAGGDWEDGRYMIRRSDGTISSVKVTSFVLPAAPSNKIIRLCIAKILDGNEAPGQIAPVGDLTREPDDIVSLFLEGTTSQTTGDDRNNLVRLDDWREGEEIVLTGGSFRALIESLDAALIGLDENGTIKFINKAVETLLNQPASKLEGTPFASAFRAASAAKLSRFFNNPQGAEQLTFSRSVILEPVNTASKKDHLVLRLHALREKSPIRYCAFLKPRHQKSETPVSGVPGAAPSTKRRADFVAQISHEIRTPLNAILGFSDLMLSEGMGPIGNEKYKEYMQDIHDSGELILNLINDILDLAKVDAGGISVEMKGCNLETRIRQAVSMTSAQAHAKAVTVSVQVADPLPIIFADERSVMQILLNLLGNAIKFTGKGGEVRITAQPGDKDHVSLVVEDTGVGMTKEDLKRALKPFQQVDTAAMIETSRGDKGTGLGLPITKSLAEANNALFHIESERDKGTRIEVLFNRARAAAE